MRLAMVTKKTIMRTIINIVMGHSVLYNKNIHYII